MARKILNRRELAAQAEAAGTTADKPKKEKAAAPKRKSRAKKEAAEVKLKAFWGVFNQSLKRVAVFEHSDKKEAEKKAEELGGGGKSPHFVQLVKEVLDS